MRLVSAFALLAIAACGQPPATPAGATVPTAEQPASTSAARTRTKVEGWETDLTAFARMAAQLPSREAIAMNPDGAVLPTAPNAQYAVVTMLSAATTDVKAFQTFYKYVTRLPVEFQVVYMRDLLSLPHGGSCQATKEFIDWGMKHSNIVL